MIRRPPDRLHRVNGFEATQAIIEATRGSRAVRDGTFSPSRMLTELERLGYYLGVEAWPSPEEIEALSKAALTPAPETGS